MSKDYEVRRRILMGLGTLLGDKFRHYPDKTSTHATHVGAPIPTSLESRVVFASSHSLVRALSLAC